MAINWTKTQIQHIAHVISKNEGSIKRVHIINGQVRLASFCVGAGFVRALTGPFIYL